ncbi:MAG TPA: hypothetical protein VF458_24315 [Ktedonobacteraceae bacterium]
MRIQNHVQLSALAAAAAWPWLKKDVWIPFTASILIDADHYIWYAITHRTLSLRATLHYYQRSNPPQFAEQRLLHQPLVLGLLLFLAVRTRSRLLSLILAGLLFHVGLDHYHKYQMRTLKRTLNEQAHFTCPQCGQQFPELELHTIHTPKLVFKHYQPQNFLVLCPTCHHTTHEQARARKLLALSNSRK